MGTVAGIVTSSIYFFFPVVRKQNILFRAPVALIPGYLLYKFTIDFADELYWNKGVFKSIQRVSEIYGLQRKTHRRLCIIIHMLYLILNLLIKTKVF